jgi:hypothetical protein
MPVFENNSAAVTAPTIDVINTISALIEPVNRNLQITACYGALSNAFASRTGVVANWCTFATWASKQAGVTIRGEDLRKSLEAALTTEPEIQQMLSVISVHAEKLIKGATQQNLSLKALYTLIDIAKQKASDAVARGNKKVFEEIGLEFARFMATCLKDEVYSEASINDFCKKLRPGMPPNGQEYLDNAFRLYYTAFFEKDLNAMDELILLANIQIGFHEQTRLQPEIAESLNAGMVSAEQVKKYVTDLLVNSKDIGGKILYFFTWLIGGTRLFKKAIDDLVLKAEKYIRQVITKHLMTLTLPPANCLHLGDDLAAPYPEALKIIEYTDLLTLLKQLKPSADAIDGAGCKDWSDLKERIHYIANLFRCYQKTKDLFDDPFTAEQLVVIRRGELPGGQL